MIEKFDKEKFLKGDYNQKYFDFTKKGYIIPSSFEAPLLSEDIQKCFKILTMSDNKEIYVYNKEKGFYEPYGAKNLRAIIKKTLGIHYAEPFAKATIDDISACVTVNREDVEPPFYLLPVANGLLSIRDIVTTGKIGLANHSSAYFFTNRLPFEYKPNVEEPKFFLKFLEEVLPSKIERMRLQEHMGYLFYRKNIFELAVILLGPENTGKSTFLNLLQVLLGNDNVCNTTVQELVYDRFATAQLYHKMAMLRSETPQFTIRQSHIIKSVITGDRMNVQFKYGKKFDMHPYTKIYIGANEAPRTLDRTMPFFKRWDPFRFDVKFEGKDCDRFLINKLTSPKELSGIANFALEGLKRLMKQQYFTGLKPKKERRNIWELSSSSVYNFCQFHVEIDYDQFETKQYFNECYYSFCAKNDLNAVDRQQIAKELLKIFPKVRSYRPKIDDKQTQCWKGIRAPNWTM